MYYVPEGKYNIVSEYLWRESGLNFSIDEKTGNRVVKVKNEIVLSFVLNAHFQNVCSLELKVLNEVEDERIVTTLSAVKLSSGDLELLREKYLRVHYSYGHVEIDKLIQLAKIGKLEGLSLQECYKVKSAEIRCIACDKSKIKRLPVDPESKRKDSEVPLEMVCVDVLDLGNISLDKYKSDFIDTFSPVPEYVSGIIDDKSRFVDVENCSTKNESEDHIIKFLKSNSKMKESENGDIIPLVHTTIHGDGAYKTNKLQEFCEKNGFKLSIVPPHTHHNVYIEQYWRSLLKAIRSTFELSKAPLFTIGYVVKCCNFNLNQLNPPNCEVTKFESFYSRPVRKKLVHSPLCDVIVAYEPGEKAQFKIGKIDPKGYLCMYLTVEENDLNFDSFIVYDPIRNRIVTRRNCYPFYDDKFSIAQGLNGKSLLSSKDNGEAQDLKVVEPMVHDLEELFDYDVIQDKIEIKEEEVKKLERKDEDYKDLIEAQEEQDAIQQVDRFVNRYDRNARMKKRNRLKNIEEKEKNETNYKIENNSNFIIENINDNINDKKEERKVDSKEMKDKNVDIEKEIDIKIDYEDSSKMKFNGKNSVSKPVCNSPTRFQRNKLINENKKILLASVDINLLSESKSLLTSHHRVYIPYNEAMNSSERMQFQEAIAKEVKTIMEFNTFLIVDVKEVPVGSTIIGFSLLLSKKFDENGKLSRFKARLVLRGDHQKEGDYDETSSPVLDKKSFRIILSLAVENGLLLKQFDIVNAYLHAIFDKDMYVEIPPGFPGYGTVGKVYKLNKALYGTKQSGFLYFCLVRKFMLKSGFKESLEDECLFYKRSMSGSLFIVGIYVDDNTVAIHPEDEKEFEEFIESCKKEFKIEDVLNAKWILGMKLDYNLARAELHLTQSAYIEKILERFDMKKAKPLPTPAIKINNSNRENVLIGKIDRSYPYLEAVGSLLYLAICTRPDILYAVNYCAQHSCSPTNTHIKAIKRIFRYLVKTKERGLMFKRSSRNSISREKLLSDFCYNIIVYSDAAFDVTEDSKSQSGFIILINGNNVYSNSKKQNIIAQSSYEAELTSLVEASNESIGIKYLVEEIVGCEDVNNIIYVFTDSQSSIDVITNKRTRLRKHINRKFNILKERIENEEMNMRHMNTNILPADLLTKPLEQSKFELFADMILGYKDIPLPIEDDS